MKNLQLRTFELFREHKRLKTVALQLSDSGSEGQIFSSATVSKMLSDYRCVESGEVPQTLWDECQGILAANKKQGVARQVTNLFSGLLFCTCGQKMYVPSGSKKYVCSECREKIAKDDLEGIVVSKLREAEDSNVVDIAGLWQNLDLVEKREVVESTIEKISANGSRVSICFYAVV